MSSTRGPDAWPLGGGGGRGRPRGMGRGLAAIMAVSTEPGSEVEEFRQVAVELIFPNPRQPRRHFDDAALAGLASSMQTRGMLQPVLVRPLDESHFELIAGERRWRAAQLAGLDTIPALVRARDDAESLELALIENMARQDLTPVEEARACAALVEELGLSREEVGLRIGRSRVAVSNLVRLLDLPDEALELLERGLLSEGHGRALLTATDHDARRQLARSAAAEGWSVRVLEERARAANHGGLDAERSRAPAREVHPDQLDACVTIAESLTTAVGADVKVSVARGGTYRAELLFESPEQALELAARIARSGAAPA
jgi:ParB family chromosome partitioning protein